MNRGICSVVFAIVAGASSAGCSTSVSGTAMPASTPPPVTRPAAATTTVPAPTSTETTGTASLVIDGKVPAGGDRLAVVCDDLGGTLFVMSKDSAIVLTISLSTSPPPASLSMLTILDPDAGTLSNEGPFTVDVDGRTYRLAGTLSALGGGADAPATRAATITVTC